MGPANGDDGRAVLCGPRPSSRGVRAAVPAAAAAGSPRQHVARSACGGRRSHDAVPPAGASWARSQSPDWWGSQPGWRHTPGATARPLADCSTPSQRSVARERQNRRRPCSIRGSLDRARPLHFGHATKRESRAMTTIPIAVDQALPAETLYLLGLLHRGLNILIALIGLILALPLM